jgi:endoglucanase
VTVWRTTGGILVDGTGGCPVVRSSTPVEVAGRLERMNDGRSGLKPWPPSPTIPAAVHGADRKGLRMRRAWRGLLIVAVAGVLVALVRGPGLPGGDRGVLPSTTANRLAAAAAPAPARQGARPAAARRGAPAMPLATNGARIVDADGRTVILQGVNWFGFETSAHIVHGLWSRDYRDVLAQIRDAGFNTIRLPFSLEALESQTVTGIDFSSGRNAPLRGKTPLQAMDAIIDAAAREHLMVLLDNHSLSDDGYQYPLWYGDGGYTEDDWIAAWRRLAARYAGRPNVIGADLKNEPHGPATWGTGGPTDWRRAAERAGRAVAEAAPDWLVVVEGIEGRAPGQRLDRHWWGGNVEGARGAPVRLPHPGRLVYSPHEYGPGVFPQPWFSSPRMAAVLEHRWRTGFGFLVEQDIAPVLIGEWGGREVGDDTTEGRWQRGLVDYLARTGISWTYWALNPNSGDTGGVLRDDWTTFEAPKLRLLQQLIRRAGVPVSRRPASPPRPAVERRSSPPRRAAAPSRSSDGTSIRLVLTARWADGWCGNVELRSRSPLALAGHVLRFRLPAPTTIEQVWNGEPTVAADDVTVRLPEWARVDGGAPYTATGMCANGTSTASALALR